MSRISIPRRSTASSAPGCGPDAVATAPVTTISAQPTTPTMATSRSQRGATGAPRPRACPHASPATTTASATTTSASRKWDITASGCRSRITVRPPSGIWAIVPRKAASAVRRTQRGSPSTRRDASHVTSAARIPTTATTRFPNSTMAWKSFAGNGVSPHRGQLSQPRPDPVSRTNAPDVTTSASAATEPRAIRTNRAGETGPRRRAAVTEASRRSRPRRGPPRGARARRRRTSPRGRCASRPEA